MNVHGKFDMAERPRRPGPLWTLVEWAASAFMLLTTRHKYVKHGYRRIKGPAIILSTHASFVDFPIALRASFPHTTRWVCSIEEFNQREWLFRHIGVICKRKFTNDIVMVRHVLFALRKQKANVIIYPEARFSLIGINEQLDNSLGKLAKAAHVPVYVLNCHGDFIRSPQWDKHPYRKIPLVTDGYLIASKEEVAALPAEEIQRRIEERFVTDDFAWQKDHHYKVKNPERATNLHKVLYQCPHCLKEHTMNSKGTTLWCESCGVTYELDEAGSLKCLNGPTKFTHAPDWYRWERQNIRDLVRSGKYHFEDDVYIEDLVSSHEGFVRKGVVHFTQDDNGIVLDGVLDDKTPFHLHKPIHSMYSIHVEYDYKGRGDALDIATVDDTWFVYPKNAKNVLTKLHFATEELFQYHKELGDKK